jgi:hypothetical protein
MSELYTPNLRFFWKALVTMLATQTSKPVAFGRVPDTVTYDADNLLIDPYVIVTPLIASQIDGSWAAPAEQVTVPLQLSSVGRDDEQAQWMADVARQTLLGRSASGAFTNDITVADVKVIDRRPTYIGGAVPAGGGLWEAIDSFDLEITVGVTVG